MDSKNRNEKRRTAKVSTCKIRRENPRKHIEESDAFQKSHIEKESATRRNIKESAKKIRNIYVPIKEQLQVLVEYINILEKKPLVEDCILEIKFIVDMLEYLRKHCEILMNCQAIKAGKNG